MWGDRAGGRRLRRIQALNPRAVVDGVAAQRAQPDRLVATGQARRQIYAQDVVAVVRLGQPTSREDDQLALVIRDFRRIPRLEGTQHDGSVGPIRLSSSRLAPANQTSASPPTRSLTRQARSSTRPVAGTRPEVWMPSPCELLAAITTSAHKTKSDAARGPTFPGKAPLAMRPELMLSAQLKLVLSARFK